jgi:hypothetical protein
VLGQQALQDVDESLGIRHAGGSSKAVS